tara:strand:+ start:3540 stop:3782 length:243 start_codon:yes stop_codon:yes gene_type:complete
MLKEEVRDQILNYILNMIPEKVRKIVGWILIIFGAVAMLGGWFVAFFFSPPEMGIIIFIVGIFSIFLGIPVRRGRVLTWL